MAKQPDAAAAFTNEEKRGNLSVVDVPPRDINLGEHLRRYQNVRRAAFLGCLNNIGPRQQEQESNGSTPGLLISTRFSDAPQIHLVAQPLGMREQLTFFSEPISQAVPAPENFLHLSGCISRERCTSKHQTQTPVFIYGKDKGGDEQVQYYLFPSHTLLTDATSMNRSGFWCQATGDFLFTSNKRDGVRFDLYAVEGRKLGNLVGDDVIGQSCIEVQPMLLLASTTDGYLSILDSDQNCILLQHYKSVTDSRLIKLNRRAARVTASRKNENIDSAIGGDAPAERREGQTPPLSVQIAPDRSSGHQCAISAACLIPGGDPDSSTLAYASDEGGEFATLKIAVQTFSGSSRSGSSNSNSNEDGERLGVSNFAAVLPDWNITDMVAVKEPASESGASLARIYVALNEAGVSTIYQGTVFTEDREHGGRICAKPFTKIEDIPIGVLTSDLKWSDRYGLVFSMTTPDRPSDIFSFGGHGKKALTRWTKSEIGGLTNTEDFAKAELIEYASFDGLQISAFVYRAKKWRGKPQPVLIHPHGGPEGQHRPKFAPVYQYLAVELGICVIDPNVRGSSGYGKSFVTLDDCEKREDSVKDIGCLIENYIKPNKMEFDTDKIGIWGGSYGGYMVLASLVHFPSVFKCGVDMVGISNFVTFLENTSGYRRALRRLKYGDETDVKMRKKLTEISPLTRAKEIVCPLFVVQGKNDPRVPESEARQIFGEVSGNKRECWYMCAEDEGHGFKKKENVDAYQEGMVMFLRRFLLKE